MVGARACIEESPVPTYCCIDFINTRKTNRTCASNMSPKSLNNFEIFSNNIHFIESYLLDLIDVIEMSKQFNSNFTLSSIFQNAFHHSGIIYGVYPTQGHPECYGAHPHIAMVLLKVY